MTDRSTIHPKTGPINLSLVPAKRPILAPKRGFDPAFLGGRGPAGPKGPKGKPIPLPGKSRGR